MTQVNRIFNINGSPFFPLGGQARNSSGYSASEARAAFEAVKLIHGNTLEIPVYWQQVEPEEGTFDFSSVDMLLREARQSHLRLVLLWFGTWKNGTMDYVPDWVKTHPEKYRRVISPSQRSIWVLSSHCEENFLADRRAFMALCRHLKERDSKERTVIALQIENEPGILGSDRDYSLEAQRVFEAPVPADLVLTMQTAGKGRIYDLWEQAGKRISGSWAELFGWNGGEIMTAWSIATYIDRLAESGKSIYNIPMYINVWLGDFGWSLPGETYPSGGGVSRVLDIYKWCTPHVDLIAPDIYISNVKGYEAVCAAYAREDNPLFVPESAPGGSNAWLLFRALVDYAAIGYAFFAVEHTLGENGGIRPDLKPVVESFHVVSAFLPLLLRYQGTARLYAVVQEENMDSQYLDFDGWHGLVHFGIEGMTDWRHLPDPTGSSSTPGPRRGRGLVVQAGPAEFYLAGVNFQLVLRPKEPPEKILDSSTSREFLAARQVSYVSVEEGHFDEHGEFICDRRRNGDEVNSGLWVEADTGVVRAVLC